MTDNATNDSAGIGYLDGEYMPHSELRIPVTDLGFQLSDMCYDALHVWKGRFFRADAHMERWERSIAARRFETLGVDRAGTMQILNECVRRAGLREAMVYLVATRGSPDSALKDLRTCRNRLFAWAVPYYGVVSKQEMQDGCDIIVSKVERIPPSSVDPTVKNFGRLDFCDALFEAYDRDAKYALLVDRDGNVTEGRGWNIFALFGGRLVSPDDGVLQGVTRGTVLELCDRLNVEGELARLPAADLMNADEVFITSTAGGVMPVRRIDDRPVANGSPGPVTRRLTELYWALHDDDAHTTPVNYGD